MKITIPPLDHLDPDESLDVGPFTFTLRNDSCAESPWSDWDGLAPLLVYGLGSGLRDIGPHLAPWPLSEFFENVKPRWATKNRDAICAALHLDPKAVDTESVERAAYMGGSKAHARHGIFKEVLDDLRPQSWGTAKTYLESLQTLYRLIGWPAVVERRNGYTHGDSVLVLAVAAPLASEARKVKAPLDPQKAESALQADISLYGHWVFGDVYGYEITDKESGETMESVWRFFGPYYTRESGLWGSAESDLRHLLRGIHKERRDKVKALIRARVPLSARVAILSGFDKSGLH